jgi:hypothetical protein
MIPSSAKAKQLLSEASKLNPGPWVKHSEFVALAAKNIAHECQDLNENTAYVLGLLHDIGRRYGFSHIKHILDGYNFLIDLGYPFAAQIALTHSFPNKNIKSCFGKVDCSAKELVFLREFLKEVKYTAYDELIQLCDALALPSGFSLLEKRMVDVFLRHGPCEFMQEKWLKTFEIKTKFEKKMAMNIYDLLPGVKENTFN